jgi:ribonuclease J
MAQAKIAKELGIDKEHIFILRSGDVLTFCEDGAKVGEKVQAGTILVDGLGVGDVGNVVLRDRQKLADDGIIVVTLALDGYNNQVVSGPEVVSRGFVYVRESDELIDDATDLVLDEVTEALDRNITDWNKLKNIVKDALSDFIWKKTKRRPMILPIIMDSNY